MGDQIITITGSNRADKTLTFEHGDTVNAHQGDQVTWVLGPGCGVAGITAIKNYIDSPDVFSIDPALVPGSTNWQGTIKSDVAFETEESYSITWTSLGGGWHGENVGGIVTDPKITIRQGTR